ncbi:class I SAM-dependent methyltransferase [Fulvivirga maritima]|uniref:class I SAM-dependent methyltransferase n=1 Tax=Fulvivirga maritima TaxID=2904247 RepID=UPI001F48D2A5|nr:class I SAM-dependent methyltransferase [Fulvivirga maritima]UII25160.1 class I SAM-dependent methyltransferase [Fulvivirga maritima]
MKDNFSRQAKGYAQYRPHYPQELYDTLFARVTSFSCAWDCATGNGQVAQQLAKKFEKVIATDISKKQLDQAPQLDNIEYLVASAEDSSIPAASVDLITVAQALHWFNHEAFIKEARKVATPEAWLCYWGYGLIDINKEANKIIRHFHDDIIGPNWDPERTILMNEYDGISFGLRNYEKQYFKYTLPWTIEHMEGYLNTWSSVQKYISTHQKNPVSDVISQLKKVWNEDKISFPIFLHSGRL